VLPPGPIAVKQGLNSLQIRGGQLATLAYDVVADLLPLIEVAHAGTFDCGNVDENVLSTIVGLNETEALLGIKPFYRSRRHGIFLKV
jgi:hypothetical protein